MSFEKEGYVISKNFWNKTQTDNLLESFLELLLMQGKKLNIKLEENIDSAATKLIKLDPVAYEKVIRMMIMAASSKMLASNTELLKDASIMLGSKKEALIIGGPSILVNFPNTENYVFTWHCESNWYPFRRNFLNIWTPLLHPKTKDNGTMFVKLGSHKKQWYYFSEYKNKDLLLQYEIPINELNDYKEMAVELNPNDLFIFHQNLVHRSSNNISSLPSYAMTMKIFDYYNDLTISENFGERPYRYTPPTQNVGRKGLQSASQIKESVETVIN